MASTVPGFTTLVAASLLLIDVASGAVVAGRVPVRLDSILGPHWEGYVDTEADVFVLTSWTEDRNTYWTPALDSLPIVMPALDSTGLPYDVPDDFGILGIGATWAFVGPDVGDIEWDEGVTRWGGLGFRVAWGASMTPGTRPVEVDYTGDEYVGGIELGTTFIGFRSTFTSVSIPEPGTGFLLVGALTLFGRRNRIVPRSNPKKKRGQNKTLVGSADSASSSLRSGAVDPALPQL